MQGVKEEGAGEGGLMELGGSRSCRKWDVGGTGVGLRPTWLQPTPGSSGHDARPHTVDTAPPLLSPSF